MRSSEFLYRLTLYNDITITYKISIIIMFEPNTHIINYQMLFALI